LRERLFRRLDGTFGATRATLGKKTAGVAELDMERKEVKGEGHSALDIYDRQETILAISVEPKLWNRLD
jgi:hypothetical protein